MDEGRPTTKMGRTAMDTPDLSRLAAIDFGPDINRLTEGFVGREWLFDAIDDWLEREAERFFILTGEPGVGKSAIAARLTQVRKDTAAYHFCIAGSNSTVVPGTALRSLAAQLGDRLPGYGQALANTVKPMHLSVQVDIDVKTMTGGQITGVVINHLHAGDPEEELDILLRAPLAELPAPPAPVLILVDSLDEAVTYRGQVNLVTLLAEVDDLPPWVRFVCTSRPEQRVLRYFDGLARHVLTAESQMNLEDIARYITYRVAKDGMPARLQAAEIEPEYLADALAKLAGGNFLYAKVLLNDAEAGRQPLDDLEALPQSLDEIYHGFLTRFTVREWEERYQPLLGVLAVAQEPLVEDQLASFVGLSPTKVRQRLGVLIQFLESRKNQLGVETYTLFHASLRLYLTDKKRNRDYWCSPGEHHESIAMHLLAACRDRWHVCPDSYALHHIALHLAEAARASTTPKRQQELEQDLISQLRDRRYREAKVSAFGEYELLSDINVALALRPDLSDLLRLAIFGLQCRIGSLHRGSDLTPKEVKDGTIEIRWHEPLSIDYPGLVVTRGDADGMYVVRHQQSVDASPDQVYDTFSQLGGDRGWLHANWAWRLWIWSDFLFGDGALRLGRRDMRILKVGDQVDFWRVEALIPGKLLLLESQMLASGRAWLEFEVAPVEGDRTELIVTSYSVPQLINPTWGQRWGLLWLLQAEHLLKFLEDNIGHWMNYLFESVVYPGLTNAIATRAEGAAGSQSTRDRADQILEVQFLVNGFLLMYLALVGHLVRRYWASLTGLPDRLATAASTLLWHTAVGQRSDAASRRQVLARTSLRLLVAGSGLLLLVAFAWILGALLEAVIDWLWP
jgi:hypothetical protein